MFVEETQIERKVAHNCQWSTQVADKKVFLCEFCVIFQYSLLERLSRTTAMNIDPHLCRKKISIENINWSPQDKQNICFYFYDIEVNACQSVMQKILICSYNC